MLITHATEFDVEIVNINVGEMYVAVEQAKIMTLLGSCVAICLWDSKLRIGGMNHYLLPHSAHNKSHNVLGCDGINDYRYGYASTEVLIQRLYFAGVKKGKLVAKIFGGGEVMYSDGLKKPLGKSVGINNIALAVEFLSERGIPIVAKDVGGTDARKIIFNTETGQVLVKRLSIGVIRDLEFTDIPFTLLSCPNDSVGHPALKPGFPPKARGNDRVVICGILVIAESLNENVL